MERLSTRLRQERERLHLSVKECSEATKIREPFLQALEHGEFTVLPPVYITSFVRSYASFLGIPSADVSALLDDIIESDEYGEQRLVKQPSRVAKETPAQQHQRIEQQKPPKGSIDSDQPRQPQPLETPEAPRRRRLILAIIVVVVGVAAVWWLLKEPDSTAPSDDAGELLSDPETNSIAPTDSLILTAVARDTVWLTVTSDGYASTQAVMMPGDEAQWSAMEKFTLSLGNAGGVTFSRNGQQLEPFGKSGEAVRSVLITRTDIRKSSDVWKPPPPKQPASAVATTTSSEAAKATQAVTVPKPVVAAPKAPASAQPAAQAPVVRPRAIQRRVVPKPSPRPAPRPARRPQSIPDITPAPVRPPQR
jgi:cytoskeleton protein RodZ